MIMNNKKTIQKMKDWLENIFYRDYGEEQKEQKLKLIALDKTMEALKDHIAEQTGDITETKGKIELLEKYRDRKPPYNNGASDEILTLICYGSLAYCCGLKKPCVWRDSALNLLEISAKDYEKMKKEFHDKIMDGRVLHDKEKTKDS